MKKLLSMIAALLLCLSAAAHAEGVLVPGWDQLPAGQLTEARDAINARLDQLSREAAAGKSMTFSGRGQGIINGFDLQEGAYAYMITLAEPVTGTMVICEDGKNYTARHYNAYSSYAHAAHYKKPMAIDYITMDFETDWTLTVTPLPDASSAVASGTGSGVSGFFLPSAAQQVEISVTAQTDGYYDVSVLEANIYRTNISGHSASYGTLEAGETRTSTYLLAPDREVFGYVWFVNCPAGFSWSISCK